MSLTFPLKNSKFDIQHSKFYIQFVSLPEGCRMSNAE